MWKLENVFPREAFQLIEISYDRMGDIAVAFYPNEAFYTQFPYIFPNSVAYLTVLAV